MGDFDFNLNLDIGDLSTDFSIQDEADPLKDVEYIDNCEQDSKAELRGVLTAFQQRAKDENFRHKLATDSEYWCAICFSSREQKEHFLKALDLIQFGDKYLDGYKVAKKLNVQLPEEKLKTSLAINK